jgi:hypothetical protein
MYKKVYRQVGGALPSTIPRQHVGLLGVLPGAPTPTPLSGTLPPQNQGLSGLDPHAYMRRTVDDYVKSYNLARQGTGAAAQRVMERPRLVAGTGLRSIREGVGDQTIKPSSIGSNISSINTAIGNTLGSLIGLDEGYLTPAMEQSVQEAALNALKRQGIPASGEGIKMEPVDYLGSDWGEWEGYANLLKEKGIDPTMAALTYGGGTVKYDPTTGQVSLTPGSGDYDMSKTANFGDIWEGGILGQLGLDDKKPLNIPMSPFIHPDWQPVDEYGGISALPEAQPTTPALPESPITPTIPAIPEVPTTPAIPEVPTTPGSKVYYTDSTGSTLYPGYLGLDYGDPGFMPDFEKKYTESPYKTSWEDWNSSEKKNLTREQKETWSPDSWNMQFIKRGIDYQDLTRKEIDKFLADIIASDSWIWEPPQSYYEQPQQMGNTGTTGYGQPQSRSIALSGTLDPTTFTGIADPRIIQIPSLVS